jgi:KaiC/GvpD/RAD55 family RecA-like ATPase
MKYLNVREMGFSDGRIAFRSDWLNTEMYRNRIHQSMRGTAAPESVNCFEIETKIES